MTRALLIAVALALCGSAPSGGWSPDADDDAPIADPVGGPTDATTGPDLTTTPPDAFAPLDPAAEQGAPLATRPEGLYQVNQPWTSDEKIVDGDRTTYTSTAENRLTGTYARVASSVATGQSSPYDGSSFNARMTRSDGRPVAGTYYENYLPTAEGFVLVSIVFFQDDSELALHPLSIRAPPQPASVPVVDDARIPPLQLIADERLTVAPPGGLDLERPIIVTQGERDVAEDLGPLSRSGPSRLSVPARATPDLRVGVDPTLGTRVLESLEVARGQSFALRVNATSEGRQVAVESWSLLSGTDDAANPWGWQSADTALLGQWLRLAPPGTPWVLSLRVRARLADGRSVEGDGRIEVWVRAPAVVE